MAKTSTGNSGKRTAVKLRSVTPHIVVRGAEGAINFFTNVFGAEELTRIPSPDGGAISFAKVRIGDSIITLSDEMTGNLLYAPTSIPSGGISLHVYVDDVDAVWQTAIEHGATVAASLADVYWGDRVGAIIDPFGVRWTVATRIEKLSDQEIRERAEKIVTGVIEYVESGIPGEEASSSQIDAADTAYLQDNILLDTNAAPSEPDTRH